MTTTKPPCANCGGPLPTGRRRFCGDKCAAEWRPDPKTCEAPLAGAKPDPDSGVVPRCGVRLPVGRRRFCSDECRRRGQRAERVYDPGQVGKNVVRLVRSMSRNGARQGGRDELVAMWAVMNAAEQAVVDLIDDLTDDGESFTDMARDLGQSRQRLTQWRDRRGPRRHEEESVPQAVEPGPGATPAIGAGTPQQIVAARSTKEEA